MFCKSFVLLYYYIPKSMLNDNLNLRHQKEFTNILRNRRAQSEHIQLRKTFYKFYQQKIYICFRCFDHVVYNEVYNHQLFSISINFARKFCYWHRRKSSRIFLRKSCSKRFRKISKRSSFRSATFLKLYVDRQQIYKNQTLS